MKKSLLIIAIAACLAGTGCAGGYVDAQPADVAYEQGVAPGPGYVWIDGDWVWGGGRYNWHRGYWGHSRTGRTWQRGSWAHTSRGYHWNGGRWR